MSFCSSFILNAESAERREREFVFYGKEGEGKGKIFGYFRGGDLAANFWGADIFKRGINGNSIWALFSNWN